MLRRRARLALKAAAMAEKYEGLDNSGRPRQAYLDKLRVMTDEALHKESEGKIWLSAYAANNRKSDYHWQCDACFHECERRGKLQIYRQAWNQASGLGPDLPDAICDPKGNILPVQVLKSAAGFYLGTLQGGSPFTRESEKYWSTAAEAASALEDGLWTARRYRSPPPAEFTGGLSGTVVSAAKANKRGGR